MDEFLKWLKSFGGSSDEDSGGGFDFSMFDFTPDSNTGESVFDPTFGGSLPLPINSDENVFDPTFGGSLPIFGNPKLDEPSNLTANDLQLLKEAGIDTDGINLNLSGGEKLLNYLKQGGSQALDYLKNNPGKVGLMAALTALGAMDKRPAYGGGTTKRYTGPAQQLTRTVTQGKYGPIAKFAAQGGTMHAYANGGKVAPVPMQDGGFVMTKRAVDGAGGPQGIQSLVPQARMIRGPGTGTSDSIPAYIQGPNGQTPARVSNGEAYVPPQGDNPTERAQKTRQLYALMKSLERRA